MSILARDNRVLYVEPQLSVLHIFKNLINGLGRISRCLRGVSGNGSLYIYTPMPVLPFANYSIVINKINQKILLICLRRLVKKIRFRRPILWIYTVNSVFLAGRMDEKLVIYYCIDDFRSEIAVKRRMDVLSFLEDSLLIKADVVFTCAKSILEARKTQRPDIHFIRNGVDFGLFSRKSESGDAPPDMKDIPSPRIGCIGTLDSRVDVSLLSFIASNKPDWQIVLIGLNLMRLKDNAMLKGCPNIHFLGFKKHELLPRYINMMDVCIIPYHTGGFHRGIFPLKTLEYLAAGKPVVSTNLIELAEFQKVVRLSDNREEFIYNIDFCLKNKCDLLKGQEIAAALSWDSRVNNISEVIAQELKGRNVS